jgi:hypothetical protein
MFRLIYTYHSSMGEHSTVVASGNNEKELVGKAKEHQLKVLKGQHAWWINETQPNGLPFSYKIEKE